MIRLSLWSQKRVAQELPFEHSLSYKFFHYIATHVFLEMNLVRGWRGEKCQACFVLSSFRDVEGRCKVKCLKMLRQWKQTALCFAYFVISFNIFPPWNALFSAEFNYQAVISLLNGTNIFFKLGTFILPLSTSQASMQKCFWFNYDTFPNQFW